MKGVSPSHNRSLDGLRFMAFLLVFFFHALQNSPIGNWPIIRFGYLGVPIFFVLSGFLIGRILLDLRDDGRMLLGQKLKLFYIRRSLRIFPVYYLFIGILALLSHLSGRYDPRHAASLPWHLLYLTNFRSFFIGMDNMYEGHFWSLAVEEHFYLLAPLVVLVMHPARLARLIGGVIVAVAAARFWIYKVGSARDFWVLSPMQFDLLGLGIATAIIEKKGSFLRITAGALRILGLIGAVIFILYIARFYFPVRKVGPYLAALGSLSLGLVTASSVLYLWTRPTSLAARFLGLRPFAYLGQISYGLYLFHPNCLGWTTRYFGHHTFTNAFWGLGITILVAMLSWHAFEKPINNLKSRFSYAKKATSPRPALVADGERV